ncbi:hypothetical protein GCM10022236_41790 [Microlunatus ginsengisoli]|uniref:Uncharacterized protein n=1 Tax=Microlunatus ginsengisoli TaxID=363863 RepID=A0ABP7ALI8_9ACTN
MSEDECIHGMTRAWCSVCRSPDTGPPQGAAPVPYGGRSRQLLMNELCDLLDVPRYQPVPGSNPSRVFSAAAVRADVASGSMSGVGEAIATKAGLVWGPECVNRRRHQPGTVVSREGVGMIVQALNILAMRAAHGSRRRR